MKVSGPACLWNRTASDGAVRSFAEAYDAVHGELAYLAGSGVASGEIFAAHLQMLEDPMVRETVEANLAAGMSDREAVEAARDSICAMFADIDDEYLRARSDDVRDVFQRLINALCGAAFFCSQCPPGAPSILASCVIRSADNLSAAAE